MDYGHTQQVQSFADDNLFEHGLTEGVGDAPENSNPDTGESLHSTDQTISWDMNQERNPQNIGNFAMSASERTTISTPELGAIVDLEMPPGVEIEKLSWAEAPAERMADASLDFNLVRENARRDVISPETLKFTEHTVEKFEKGKISPAELDDLRWKSTKAYLKNSFGRDLEGDSAS